MRTGYRDAATDALRAKVLSAARRALTDGDGVASFSVDAIAAKAGVARSQLHQQFGTVSGVLEALLDDFAAHRALADELPRVFQLANPLRTLDEFVAVYGRVWDAERLALRKVRSLAALDAQLGRALAKRDEYRREGLRRLLAHLARNGVACASARARVEPLDALFALTAFETFDALAGTERSIAQIVPAVQHLARAALGLGSA